MKANDIYASNIILSAFIGAVSNGLAHSMQESHSNEWVIVDSIISFAVSIPLLLIFTIIYLYRVNLFAQKLARFSFLVYFPLAVTPILLIKLVPDNILLLLLSLSYSTPGSLVTIITYWFFAQRSKK